jgi:hypothetical protein
MARVILAMAADSPVPKCAMLSPFPVTVNVGEAAPAIVASPAPLKVATTSTMVNRFRFVLTSPSPGRLYFRWYLLHVSVNDRFSPALHHLARLNDRSVGQCDSRRAEELDRDVVRISGRYHPPVGGLFDGSTLESEFGDLLGPLADFLFGTARQPDVVESDA